MSIEMENPKTVLEKIDAAANLVEQMNMAHMIKDENHFRKTHKQAGELLFKAMRQLEDGKDLTPDVKDLDVHFFVSFYGPPYRACFRIGVETFHVCEKDDEKEAEWFVGCLRTAFKNYKLYHTNQIIDEAIDGVQKYFDYADLDAPALLIQKLESLKNKPI